MIKKAVPARPLCSRLRHVHDRQMDARQTDVTSDAHHHLMPPAIGAGTTNLHSYDTMESNDLHIHYIKKSTGQRMVQHTEVFCGILYHQFLRRACLNTENTGEQ